MRADPRPPVELREQTSALYSRCVQLTATLLLIYASCGIVLAQNANGNAASPETTEQKVEHLSIAITQAETQMEAY